VDEKVQKVLESVGKVEEELEKENEKQAQEILAIETKYNKAKRPAYVKRSKLFEEIPGFWKQALSNHPIVGHCIDENDDKILEHLKALDVTFVDDNGGFKIELTFNENPFFTSTSLWKQVKFSDDEGVDVTTQEIAWKTSDEAKEVSESSSFFEWFSSTEGDQDIAEIIKDDLWKNPVQFYLNDDDDEEEEEGEEGDDDEDEEGEGEDEE